MSDLTRKQVEAVTACDYGTTACRETNPRYECPAWGMCVGNLATHAALSTLITERDGLRAENADLRDTIESGRAVSGRATDPVVALRAAIEEMEATGCGLNFQDAKNRALAAMRGTLSEVVALRAERDRALASLEAIADRHVQLNNAARRPLGKSRTLKLAWEGLGYTRDFDAGGER